MPPTSFLRTATFRVVLLQAALFALVVVALFSLVWRELHAYVEDQFRTAVEVETASLLEASRDGTLAAQIDQRLSVAPVGPDYYVLSDSDGHRIAGNLQFEPVDAGWHTIALSGAQGRHKTHANSAALFVSRLGDGKWLTVGRDSRDIGELDENLLRYFVVSVCVVVLLAFGSGAIAGHVFVKRVDQLGSHAERIVSGEQAGPLDTKRRGVEFERLAGRLDRMLARIRALMDNMRQVSNDIAHDLRTPLTRLRQRLESAQLDARDEASLRAAIEQSIIDVDNVLGTFGALLRVAQIQARDRTAGFAPVDVSELFVAMAEDYAPVAEDAGKQLHAEIASGVRVVGDRALLTQMLSNLIENAIHHTQRGARIDVSLRPRGDGQGWTGRVEDDGPGIPAAEHAHVFQRFVRLDSSRSKPGCGLGLALVAAIADLHRISIRLADRGPGLAVALHYPNV